MESATFWPSDLADWVTCVGGALSCVALFGVWIQLRNDGLSASANAVNSAYNSISGLFRELAVQPDTLSRNKVLREIFNQLETACALKRDGQFRGHSGRLASVLLRDLITMILEDEETRAEFQEASHDSTTFGNIHAVMKELGVNDQPAQQQKQFMKNRAEVAEIVYKDYKEMQRATFDLAGQYGRWLLASLLLIHGGALFGLFTFLSELADKPDALARYQLTVWWFVTGLMLTLFAGLCTWLNWSMNSNNYEAWANKAMLWDPDKWAGDNVHTWGVNFCYWAALILGVLSSFCIVGGAYSTLNGNWVQSVATALV